MLLPKFKTCLKHLAYLFTILTTSTLSKNASATLTDVGILPDGTYVDYIMVSKNGNIITGYTETTGGLERTITYTAATGLLNLGGFGGSYDTATGVSADGSIIAGFGNNGSRQRAFRYTSATGFVDLGSLGGPTGTSKANAISSDGNVIIGESNNGVSTHAFKYVGSTMYDLGDLGGGSVISSAIAVSSDGSVIAGNSATGSATHAFKYVGSTMTDLGSLGGSSTDSRVKGISSDGTVIVGNSNNGVSTHAFKYEGSTMYDLGDLGGGSVASAAKGISSDGTTIIGDSYTGSATHAFKYVGSTMTDLGSLGGSSAYSTANAVSEDGSVIVGSSSNGSVMRAFKYTDSEGMLDLGDLGDGVTETASYATSISSDGKVIVGYSKTASGNDHIFLSGTLSTSTLVDANNTYTALYENGNQLNSLINLNNSSLNFALEQDAKTFGANGVSISVGTRYSNIKAPTAQETAANLKIAYRFTDKIRAGIFLDQTLNNKSHLDNFSVRNQQPLTGIFAAYSEKIDGSGFQLRTAAAYNSVNLNIKRSTLAHTEAGEGDAKLTTKGLLAEAAYGLNISKTWQIQPYAGVKTTSIRRNSYTENSGADFPISYNILNRSTTTTFAGTRLSGLVTRNLGARFSLGYEHDTTSSIDGYSGTIAYMGSFNLNSPSLRKDRAVASVGSFYDLGHNQSVNFDLMYSQQSLNNGRGITAYLGYTIGL